MPVTLNLNAVIRQPSGLDPQRFRAAIARAMQKAVFAVQRRTQLNLTGAFLKVRTGRLRSSIVSRVEVGPAMLRGVVGTNVVYGRMLHEGIAPHEIRPARRRALRFTAGGRTVFAAHVHHPGVRPRPFLRAGLEASRDEIVELFRAEIAAAGRSGA